MKKSLKLFTLSLVLMGFQGVLGQEKNTETSSNNIIRLMANSGYDVVIRIDQGMNDDEINSRIDFLRSFVEDIDISYSRDGSGNIETLSSSGGLSSGSCESDDFNYLIIALKDREWMGCMISDRN